MSQSYLIGEICVLKEQEKAEAYLCSDYMRSAASFCPQDRRALCEWAYQIVDGNGRYNSDGRNGPCRLTAVIALSYFDRFMSTSSKSAQVALEDIHVSQLAFVSCLVIALKAHASFSVEVDFISNAICGSMYGVDEITEMEMEVLQALNWRLHKPTPHHFIDKFLDIIPSLDILQRNFLGRFSNTVAESALTRYSIALQFSPSEIAVGSIICALRCLDAFSSVDGSTVLYYLEMVSGEDFDSTSTRDLLRKMGCLADELHCEVETSSTVDQAEIVSVE